MQPFKIGILVLVAGLFTTNALAQNTDWIWRPVVSYSWKSSDRLSYKTKLEMFNSIPDINNKAAIQYIEPQFSLSYSISSRLKIGGGFYSRWVAPLYSGYAYEQRLLQQVSFVTDISNRQIDHRIRLEQRFRDTNYLNRLRYQLSYDLPLKGEQIDPDEKYLVMYNDMLVAFNSNTYAGENRTGIGMGWYFNSKRKFETVISYRSKNLINDNKISHVFLLTTTWSFNR